MDLAFRELGGSGAPVVILHGLFGSSQNWAGFGRRVSHLGRVLAVDLRNHGDSAHARPHSLAACVDDLREWSALHAPAPLRLIGHSMGGLAAMGFALWHPELTAGVASIDIAPRPYPPDHAAELRALRMELGAAGTRAELDALLSPVIPEERQRQFLLTNAVRDGGGFRWKIDAEILAGSTVSEDFARIDGRYEGEALLVSCGRSTYVAPGDFPLMRRFFPAARPVTLAAADHWPHVSDPAGLAAALEDFLARCNNPAARSSDTV
jgi:pimeloyl-ACP methyl ester carboxylesterase